MAVWEFILWGLVGGLLVEGVDFLTVIRSVGTLPWAVPPASASQDPDRVGRTLRPTKGAYLVCLVVRAMLGAVLATAMGLSGQLGTAVVTLMVGAAAPVMITRFAAAATASGAEVGVEVRDAGPGGTRPGPSGEAGVL